MELLIPAARMPALTAALDKMGRDAAKYNLPGLTYEITGTEVRKVQTDYGVQKLTHYHVEVSSEQIGFEGWSPVAIVEWKGGETNKPIVRVWPGLDLDEETLGELAPVCDLCDRNAYRIRVYLFQNEQGELKTVGSTCVKLFFGVNPASIAARYEMLLRIQQGDEDALRLGKVDIRPHINDVITYALATVREYGYTSRSAARDDAYVFDGDSTASLVWDKVAARTPAWETNEYKAKLAAIRATADDREKAGEIIEFVKNARAENSYMHNLVAIAESDLVGEREMGFAVSMVVYYEREMGRIERTRRAARNRGYAEEYAGEVGNRVKARVRIEKTIRFDGYYGVTTLVKMRDEDDRQLCWFASNPWSVSTANDKANVEDYEGEDTVLTLTGTIKKTEMYRDTFQTVLTRCRLSE